jgi:hypothetical protein
MIRRRGSRFVIRVMLLLRPNGSSSRSTTNRFRLPVVDGGSGGEVITCTISLDAVEQRLTTGTPKFLQKDSYFTPH